MHRKECNQDALYRKCVQNTHSWIQIGNQSAWKRLVHIPDTLWSPLFCPFLYIIPPLHHLASCKISWWCQEREWESVGIRMRPLGSTAYVACLLLLCQLLVFRRSWVWIQAGSWIFFPMDLFLTLSGENNETASFSFFYHTTEKYTVILLYTLYHSILENGSLSYPYNM